MPKKNSILVLRLESTLQAWGESSMWTNRDTAMMPTKSGIVGMLGSALGLSPDDPRLVELFNSITMATRADRAGSILSDYHTVRSDKLPVASGGKQKRTIVSNRMYIQDAAFTVFIEADKALITELANAVQDPAWPLFLGRKCCIPSRPIFCEVTQKYNDLDSAVQFYPVLDRHTYPMPYELEVPRQGLASRERYDGMANGCRSFCSRRVWTGFVNKVG